MSSHPLSGPAALRQAKLLSNGRYTVMLNAAGSGYSSWGDLAVTRWREDPTVDGWGSYVLLRDEHSGAVWSAGKQPYGDEPDAYAAALSEGRAQIVRRDGMLTMTLDVAVAGDSDAELRRVVITNHGDTSRDISLTSYAELVLGPASADAAHPAFSKMFVQTEWVESSGMLLATRRPRTTGEAAIWAAHFGVVEGQDWTVPKEYETDRAQFLGRGRSLRHAQAMEPRAKLSNTTGCVLDPIFSVRHQISIAPGASVRVAFWTVLADSRQNLLALVEPLRAPHAREHVISQSLAHAAATLARLGIDTDQAERYGRLTGPLLVADLAMRAPAEQLERGSGGAPVLWSMGISGDRPIVLLRIAAKAGLDHVYDLLLAQRYWRSKRLGIDVVVLNTAPAGDREALQSALAAVAAAQTAQMEAEGPGASAAVFVLDESAIAQDLRDGLATVARIVLDASGDPPGHPSPAEKDMVFLSDTPEALGPRAVPKPCRDIPAGKGVASGEALEFDNGIGGFAHDGREYLIRMASDLPTPAPWSNVIANPSFGFLVTAEGGGYTWSLNSQQNPLTPWPNDPVSDSPHEVLYLRDEDGGEVWSANVSPIRVASVDYTARHGKGYSRFAHEAHGIGVELLQYVPVADAVKLSRLRLCNRSGRVRKLSITAFVEWALGGNGSAPAPYVTTEYDEATGALFARNRWRAPFGERVAFIDMGGTQHSFTGDRTEFLGHFGSVALPSALTDSAPLFGRVGAGLDPCGALQTRIELAPGEQVEIVFSLGDAGSVAEAQALVEKYREADLDAVLAEVNSQWNDLLDTVQVSTPDRSMDIVLNDWLPYQTLVCRVWARTAYYQASGAYGYRDQLQDVMALCVSRPDIAREHLLRAAGRQFVQGDVQHWWLPPAGQGIRTRISDDRIWLAHVASHYVATTADSAVLDEMVPFLDGALIKEGDNDAFYLPSTASESGSLYEHCVRALDTSLALGAHGLPLMGTGDWNDGMNAVGEGGRGESAWLAWFLLAALDAFAPHAEARGEHDRAAGWRAHAATLRGSLERAWDGQWYRRGYYDDGTPLGSNESLECKIDVIAQSWSVIAGADDPAHASQAMGSVDHHLVMHKDKIALLFTPPFDKTPLNPGYIKGYPPGIRENGGQYTHGATWSVFACAKLGQGDRAAEMFTILNPLTHSSTAADIARYRVEPYAACADVYSVAPHVGRGGWTWYTGSAGWLYRSGLEAVLGFQRRGDTLLIDPCIPHTWPAYGIVYRHRDKLGVVTRYEIGVENPDAINSGVSFAELDGVGVEPGTSRGAAIALIHDGKVHTVRVVLGKPKA
jgi:cellobiose phosphorylase